jgi:protein-S-isoprenylcysteine O-methyltransferase Ste14
MRKVTVGVFFLILYWCLSASIYFVCAGRTDLPFAWLYFGIQWAVGIFSAYYLERISPGLIAERFKPGPGERDRVFKIGSSVFTVLMLTVAGLDVGRYHWSAPVSTTVQAAALIVVLVGYGFTTWAVSTNRFFSSAVRLQADRGQVVIDSGPYQLVRHPGYTGAIALLGFGGLALGSWPASAISGIPMLAILLRRTLIEDAMLRQGLPVKYRLLPGVW